MWQLPSEIHRAYEDGLPGWQFSPASMERLWEDGKVAAFADVAPHLAGVGAGKRALLWRSREFFDPGAFGQEAQTTGDCVSHGSRNARDVTRSVEIHIKKEPEEYYRRGATEPTYGARGFSGQGMDPAVAARFEVDVGFLFREKYPFADLSRYDSRIGTHWGGQGVPEAVKTECRKHNIGRWIAPRTASEAKDLLYSGYAGHSGQSFGVASRSDSRGIAVPSGRWSHDMCCSGFDDTREIYPVCVFLIVNSWGLWNSKPAVWPDEVLGPWPHGSFWVTEEIYERHFIGSRSCFFYADIAGVPQKTLPDYGNLSNLLG